MRNKKEVAKIWIVILTLNALVAISRFFLNIPEVILALQLGLISFFTYMLYSARKVIKQFEPEIKAGRGEHLFEPKYIYITLGLVILGGTVWAIMDYLSMPTWWGISYMIIVVTAPFLTGNIPLRKKDNRWRK